MQNIRIKKKETNKINSEKDEKSQYESKRRWEALLNIIIMESSRSAQCLVSDPPHTARQSTSNNSNTHIHTFNKIPAVST